MFNDCKRSLEIVYVSVVSGQLRQTGVDRKKSLSNEPSLQTNTNNKKVEKSNTLVPLNK